MGRKKPTPLVVAPPTKGHGCDSVGDTAQCSRDAGARLYSTSRWTICCLRQTAHTSSQTTWALHSILCWSVSAYCNTVCCLLTLVVVPHGQMVLRSTGVRWNIAMGAPTVIQLHQRKVALALPKPNKVVQQRPTGTMLLTTWSVTQLMWTWSSRPRRYCSFRWRMWSMCFRMSRYYGIAT